MSLRRIVPLTAVLAVLLTGCSAGGSDSSDSGGGVSADYEVAQKDSGAAAAPGEGADTTALETSGNPDYMVREAWLGLKVDSVNDAAAKIRIITTDAGGSVIREEFGDGGFRPASEGIDRYGTMTVSVPSDALDATVTQISDIGEVRTRSSNAVNVEDEYVDVEARIATLTASIERMRDLMAQTADIDQIVKLETALSQRQSDLDSLQARMNSLRSRIAMSPITVTLTTTDDLGVAETGIIGAFKDGWNDFKESAAVLVRVLAALLPWIAVGGLLLWAAVWARRRNRVRRHPAPQANPAPAPEADPPPPSRAG